MTFQVLGVTVYPLATPAHSNVQPNPQASFLTEVIRVLVNLIELAPLVLMGAAMAIHATLCKGARARLTRWRKTLRQGLERTRNANSGSAGVVRLGVLGVLGCDARRVSHLRSSGSAPVLKTTMHGESHRMRKVLHHRILGSIAL